MKPPARDFPSSAPSLHQHALSESDFDSLAGGHSDGAVLARLQRAETSYRHTMLRVVLDTLRRRPATHGPLPPPDSAWDLLVQAERRSPEATTAVLGFPQVGAWAAHLLRRLHGAVHDDTPLWVDAGYLHTLAAAAALRAGLDCTVVVPLRHGLVHLPTLGHAALPFGEPWDVARVSYSTTQGHATVTSQQASVMVDLDIITGTDTDSEAESDIEPELVGWVPRRRFSLHAFGQSLDVAMEDADPYRLVGSVARPARLRPPEARRWKRLMTDTWDLLVTGHPASASELAQALATVAPLPKAPVFRPRSSSTGDAFGGAVLSEPDDATQLAASLIHETAHFKLGALMHLFDLHNPERLRLGYAPWRDDPRPTRGILHGIYAFTAVTGFWRRQRLLAHGSDAMLAHFEFAFWRDQARATARRLQTSRVLTPLGLRFLDGVLVTLEAWCTEPVPVEVTRLANLLTLDHRAQWRAHHLRPPASRIQDLAAAWLAGRAPHPAELPAAQAVTLVPDRAVRHLDGRACLARLWLARRDEFRQLARASPETVVPGTTRIDCALISQDRTQARRGYAAALEQDPGSVSALVGLGLADPEHAALVARPELVRAVGRSISARTGRPPRLADLAVWLMPALLPTGRDIGGTDETVEHPHSGEPGGDWPPTGMSPRGLSPGG